MPSAATLVNTARNNFSGSLRALSFDERQSSKKNSFRTIIRKYTDNRILKYRIPRCRPRDGCPLLCSPRSKQALNPQWHQSAILQWASRPCGGGARPTCSSHPTISSRLRLERLRKVREDRKVQRATDDRALDEYAPRLGVLAALDRHARRPAAKRRIGRLYLIPGSVLYFSSSWLSRCVRSYSRFSTDAFSSSYVKRFRKRFKHRRSLWHQVQLITGEHRFARTLTA